MTTKSAKPTSVVEPRVWHIAGCDLGNCAGAQHIDGIHQGGCVPCHCGHTLESHYQDREDEGCCRCNSERIQTGDGALCPCFRSVLTTAEKGSSQ